jgi:hypothetical protein
MKNDNKKISERFRHALNNIKNKNNKNQNQNEILSLFSSTIINKGDNQNLKMNFIKDILNNDNNKKKGNNLLDTFIKEKVDINRKTFYKNYNYNSVNIINELSESGQNSIFNDNKIYKVKDSGTFITRINNIKKNNSFKDDKINKKKGNGNFSVNENFIKNVKDEMIKKGILIRKPQSSKIRYQKGLPYMNNYNNFELHIDTFKSKIINQLNNYIKYYESAQKKKLRDVSEELSNKKDIMTKSIPIYIKAYQKKGKDVFHSRKIYDVDYQNRYRKPSINLEELIQNQNVYSKKMKNNKFPFYHFLRTVNNPYQNLKVMKKSQNRGQIFIKFENAKEIDKNN